MTSDFKGKCYIDYYGKGEESSDFELLCNPGGVHIRWIKPDNHNKFPTNAFVGGEENYVSGKYDLYIGRGKVGNTIRIGKIPTTDKICYIWFNGEQSIIHDYEILCN